jgi:hypothetical protein
MDYQMLTDVHHVEIRRGKLLDLEATHARQTLDASLAEQAGAAPEQLAQVFMEIAFVTRQIELLRELMVVALAANNGSGEKVDA